MSAQLAAGETVRVVAETLANGAPHPFVGRTGLVDEVRAIGQYRIRVLVDGRAIMFAPAELQRVIRQSAASAGLAVDELGVVTAISDDETAVRDVR